MTYVALAACLTLLAYGIGMAAGSLLAIGLLRWGAGGSDPDARSRRLFLIRFLPTGLGSSLALGLALPAFLGFEPAGTGERVGTTLVLVAAASGAVVLAGLIRGGSGLLATRRLVREWSRRALPLRIPGIPLPAFRVDERFPLVAIAGCFRPRLYVSSTVLRHCTPGELAAIIAHESGHLRRGDTWKRVALRACPDFLALSPVGSDIERRWAEAAEQAADDHAAAPGPARSLDLASALVRVARLAGSSSPRALPLTALYRGGGVADRVSRLLGTASPPPIDGGRGRRRAERLLFVAAVLPGPAAAAFGALDPVYRFLEAAVRLLG